MEEKKERVVAVPYVVFEGSMARAERHAKRLFIALVVAVLAIVGTNIGWLIYMNQYDFTGYSYTQDGDGLNIAGDNNTGAIYGTESYRSQTDAEE